MTIWKLPVLNGKALIAGGGMSAQMKSLKFTAFTVGLALAVPVGY
jgi:hypothetical protein